VSHGYGARTAIFGFVKRVRVGLQSRKKSSFVQTVSRHLSQASYYVLLKNLFGAGQA